MRDCGSFAVGKAAGNVSRRGRCGAKVEGEQDRSGREEEKDGGDVAAVGWGDGPCWRRRTSSPSDLAWKISDDGPMKVVD